MSEHTVAAGAESDDRPASGSPNRSEERADEPDPREVWRWLGRAARPYIGYGLVALGLLALVIGWFGVSRELLVAQQMPFFVSGGLVGVALVFLGGIAMLINDLRAMTERFDDVERTTSERLEHLDELVGDLRAVLLSDPEAPDLAARSGRGGDLVVLPGGTSYHLPDCRVVQGKDAEPLEDPEGLSACKLCAPEAA